eukprot:TRINITY_DN11231_c0_g1_i3.p4 TRINITY_DN11231_c0_g1~~TRINITY_DN11231_c0_g1_i3.p4  ORF type:complete len:136 (-),score=9.69 TRINITY_DN11231_c0_g1_i3:1662-2069(-)
MGFLVAHKCQIDLPHHDFDLFTIHLALIFNTRVVLHEWLGHSRTLDHLYEQPGNQHRKTVVGSSRHMIGTPSKVAIDNASEDVPGLTTPSCSPLHKLHQHVFAMKATESCAGTGQTRAQSKRNADHGHKATCGCR